MITLTGFTASSLSDHAIDHALANLLFVVIIGQHSAQLQQSTWDYRNNVQDQWAKQRGENLSAKAPYVNSHDGSTWQLPTSATPGQVFYDNSSGNHFVMDAHGQYWMNNDQCWWQSMEYQR